MNPFTTLTTRAAVLPVNDIDTDQIIPARYLKVTDSQGLGSGLFTDWRTLPDGSPNPDFPLNQPQARGAQALLVGRNFGCGSSREHAPWALLGGGYKVVIAGSFADIFYNNALKNGLLPVALAPADHARALELCTELPQSELTIDLAAQTLTLPDGSKAAFPIDSFSRNCLLQGVDELGYLLKLEDKISAYEQKNRQG